MEYNELDNILCRCGHNLSHHWRFNTGNRACTFERDEYDTDPCLCTNFILNDFLVKYRQFSS